MSIPNANLAYAIIAPMVTTPKAVRLERLRWLLKRHGGRKAALAKAIGKAPAQVSQWLSGVRTISEESAREIEAQAWLDPGVMDRPLNTTEATAPTLRGNRGTPWPFSAIAPDTYNALPGAHRQAIETFALGFCKANLLQSQNDDGIVLNGKIETETERERERERERKRANPVPGHSTQATPGRNHKVPPSALEKHGHQRRATNRGEDRRDHDPQNSQLDAWVRQGKGDRRH